MKKVVFGLSLTMAVLGFFLSPATAAADPPQGAQELSAADRAFLASLAAPVQTPAPEPAAKRPRVGMEKALCTATASCGDGTTVYCEGNSSSTSCSAADRNCPGERGHVTCDGVTTSCPAECPGCGPDFCGAQAHDDCAASCYPCSYRLTCNFTYCFEVCRCEFRTCPV